MNKKKIKKVLGMALSRLREYREGCEQDRFISLVADILEDEHEVVMALYHIDHPVGLSEEVEAESYREMHDIATNTLGYSSILEALEATPRANALPVYHPGSDKYVDIMTAADGKTYLVFSTNAEAGHFVEKIGCDPHKAQYFCVGNYENAFLIDGYSIK